MKKILIILFIMLIALTGCDKKEEEPVMDSENLVLYFSATGNTEKIAHMIAEESSSDIMEIVPKVKYTEDDLKYTNDNCRANKEQKDENARPEISRQINIDKYNTIYIGYPIWWGTNPKIILTLLDTVNFEGKEIILFCTSGSSGVEQSLKELREYNTKLNIKDGKRFSVDTDKNEISKWLKSLSK